MPTNTPPTIPCTHCHGSGFVGLPSHLWRVLDVVGSGAGTTTEIMQAVKERHGEEVFLTAMCNRLRTLEEFGLVVKRKTAEPTGHCWHVWERVGKAK